ncbi:hypothetical protein [Ferruginivarius sediminum]|uniref:Uncharacterized protein n=1 Tax=Ferruginivarius sediminum TaxID=2661937 RepID=A0A369TAJ0_9PROT|nr:hypothetical protein [Ferruginivarius sediminum]RDD61197.1 hypothetical protein DRB17_14010 [Ferruginivarius sediminum]
MNQAKSEEAIPTTGADYDAVVARLAAPSFSSMPIGSPRAKVSAAARPEPAPASIAEGELAALAAFVAAFVLARQLRRRQTP